MSEMRRGKNGSGDKNDPNYANYDEAKANPFPDLPDSLTLKNGKKVTKASDWWNKRRHSSGHTDGPNWPFFLEFASKHMSKHMK